MGMDVTPGLAAILGPDSVARLRASIQRGEPFVEHGVCASVVELFAMPVLASLDVLLGSWPDEVQVHLPDVADESSAIAATPADARKLFANGMGLLFDEAQRHAPQLVPWLAAIRADIGLSALTQQRCLFYATPAGKGTSTHFDQNVNFVVQVYGTKTWRLAPNTHVARPMTRHTLGQRADVELQSYATLPMPEAMPADHVDIVLEPGSFLFVPRGWWHSTRASTEALALNFTFSPPTWIDILTAALRGRLARSPAWRDTAMPADAETFEALLRGLADEAPHWNADDILAVTESED